VRDTTLVLALCELVPCRDQPSCGGGCFSLRDVDFRPEESEAGNDVHESGCVRQWKGLADTFAGAIILVLVRKYAGNGEQRNSDASVVTAQSILLIALQQMF
jgi:hypothetical protein